MCHCVCVGFFFIVSTYTAATSIYLCLIYKSTVYDMWLKEIATKAVKLSVKAGVKILQVLKNNNQ